MRDLSCRTNDRDQPHGGKIRHKCALYCCDLLVVFFFLLDWCLSEQVPLSGFLGSFLGGFFFHKRRKFTNRLTTIGF